MGGENGWERRCDGQQDCGEAKGRNWKVLFAHSRGRADLHGVGRKLSFVYRCGNRERGLDRTGGWKVCCLTSLCGWAALLFRSAGKRVGGEAGTQVGDSRDKYFGQWLHGLASCGWEGVVREDEGVFVSD